jgi:hypothetical protein
MNAAVILLAIVTFSKGHYIVDHYPLQTTPWIESIEYSTKEKGQVYLNLKESAFISTPDCKWRPLNADSAAVGNLTYYSKDKIKMAFFEKDKKKKYVPQDLAFILSCKLKL